MNSFKYPVVFSAASAFYMLYNMFQTSVKLSERCFQDLGQSHIIANIWGVTLLFGQALACIFHALGAFQEKWPPAEELRNLFRTTALFANSIGCGLLGCHVFTMYCLPFWLKFPYVIGCFLPGLALTCPIDRWFGTQVLADISIILSTMGLSVSAACTDNLPLTMGVIYHGTTVMMFGTNSGALYYMGSVVAYKNSAEGINAVCEFSNYTCGSSWNRLLP